MERPLEIEGELLLEFDGGTARIDIRGETVDVRLEDASLAPRQFQVDVMGHEFYLRDLAGDTRLNGREVRFMELLPGDEIAAGATVLVFRAAGDGLGRSR